MIKTLDEATRLLNATQLMLLGKDNQPISDLYYALQIAVDSIKELKERREADRWIPVSEKLPEKDGRFLICTSSGDIDTSAFAFGQFTRPYVIAWKPLPKPYESEDK